MLTLSTPSCDMLFKIHVDFSQGTVYLVKKVTAFYCYQFSAAAWSVDQSFVVCLSSVAIVHAVCLNRLMDFDAIWQVHLRGLMTH